VRVLQVYSKHNLSTDHLGAVHLLSIAFRGEEGLRKCDNLLQRGVREFVMFSINELFFEIFDKI